MAWELGDYCTVLDVRTEMGGQSTDDDAMLEQTIRDSSREIDTYARRWFFGSTMTRYFHGMTSIKDYDTLLVDADLISVTDVEIDGTELPGTEYVLLPPNATPKYGIRIKRSSSRSWMEWAVDPDEAIAVTGTWGWVEGSLPPRDVKRACIRLTLWRYHQRQAPFETIGLEGGEYQIPSAMPADVERMLQPYRRREFASYF